jgi:hypothetical protein
VSSSLRMWSLAAAVLLLTGTAAVALGDTDVSVSGVVNGKYMYDTGVDASAFDGRLDMDLAVGPVTVGVAYRAYQLSTELYNPAGINVPPAELKHRYAAFESGDLTVRAGHFLATFGHGLTLRSYEEIDLEHDTMLDGFRGDYRIGAASLTALAGTADELLYGTRHREHRVRAARLSVPVGDWAELAGSSVERASTDLDTEIDIPLAQAEFDDSVRGGELSLWLGPVTLAAEYAGRNGENPVTGADPVHGYAAYASATVDAGPLTLFGEFKDYRDFADYLVNPPTCVREHVYTLMNRVTYEIDLDDERGFLAEGSLPLGGEVDLTGGASEARNHDGDLSYWEIFGQAEHRFWEAVTGAFGWSWSREYEFGVFTEHMSGAADLYLTTADGRLIEAALETQSTDEPTGTSHVDYLGSLTFYPGTDLTFTSVLEATTDETESRDVWAMFEVRALLPEDLETSFSMGTERGGKKCSGGVCYFEPEFEGVRLRVSKYF